MTYEDLIVAIDVAAPELESCALRLLLRLISVAIQQGTNEVRASDRWIMDQLGFSADGVTRAKRGVAKFVEIVARKGTVTSFVLPEDWFTHQRPLFASTGALVSSALRTGERGATALVNGAPAPLLSVHSALVNRAPRTGEQGAYTGEQCGAPPLSVHSALVSRAPATQNQQDSGVSSTRLDSTQKFTSSETLSRLDRIFNTVQIPQDKLADALRLRLALQRFMQECGNARAAERPPKEEILAKCLAIAGVDELLLALDQVAESRKVNPGAYIWFVVVFLDAIGGIPWKTTQAYMEERKQRKPPQRQAAADFRLELVGSAVKQVKGLR